MSGKRAVAVRSVARMGVKDESSHVGEVSCEMGGGSFVENEVYNSRRISDENRERSRAYNREYSARLRADPEKKKLINMQKRDMMRRLSERRKEEGVPLKQPVTAKNENAAPKKRPKSTRDHKLYYAEHVEAMRETNRRYYRKITADPEKRAALNEKKKLAMRRMKARRMLGHAGSSQSESTLEYFPVDSHVSEELFLIEDSSCSSRIKLEETEVISSEEIVEEILEDATETTIETDDFQQEVEEVIYEDTPVIGEEEGDVDVVEEVLVDDEDERVQDLPLTMNALQFLSGTARTDFIAYIESCAQEFLIAHADAAGGVD